MNDFALACNKLYFNINILSFFITNDYFSLLMKTIDSMLNNQ